MRRQGRGYNWAPAGAADQVWSRYQGHPTMPDREHPRPAGAHAGSARAGPVQPRTRLIAGFPAGGPVDIAARLIGPSLSRRLGERFVVENLPGGGGNAATGHVVASAPDGRTLLLCAVANTINTTLFPELPFDFERDLVAVAGLYRVPLVVEVHPRFPANDISELIEFALRHPGELRVGYAGEGTPQHIGIEQFKSLAGVDLMLVPYAGSAAVLQDLLAGRVHAMFDPLPSSIEHIARGRLRALAITSSRPLEVLPGVPLLSDVLPGYEGGSWFGISAPKGTPADRVRALNAATNAALNAPATIRRMNAFGATAMPGSPEAFAAFLREETGRHARTIAAARVR